MASNHLHLTLWEIIAGLHSKLNAREGSFNTVNINGSNKIFKHPKANLMQIVFYT